MTALERLAAELRDEGGLLADAVVGDLTGADASLGRLVAGGRRTAADPDEYALLLDTIHEGYLQHYGKGKVLAAGDPDLALLAGDRLYALGLARLAELGDLEAVLELADVISLAAQAHAESDPARARRAWEAAAAAVAAGPSKEHDADKARWRGAGSDGDGTATPRAAAPGR